MDSTPTLRTPARRAAAIGDGVMLAAIALGAAVALAIGSAYGQFGSAVLGSVLIALPAVAVVALARGSLLARMVLATAAMAMVALHIQLGRGTIEFHFGIFVALALVLVYQDWRPIVLAAVMIALQHVLADRLQAAGWAVYCAPTAGSALILLHAGYVTVQTIFEVLVAQHMARLAQQREELDALVHGMGHDGQISLAVEDVAVTTLAARDLRTALTTVAQAMAKVQASASSIHGASAEIATGNHDLSQRTEQTASSLQQAASSMEQLTATVRHSADSASQASQLAHSATEVAQRGGQVVAQMVATMSEINASSHKIAAIIGTIDGIAFQTNILALNAAVEAARAGTQGRGFAVVAAEVRSLAQRSAEAAREIKALIGASVQSVESGSRLVHDAGSTMTEIVNSVQRVTDIIGEIAAASREQSSGIGLVSATVNELDRMTQQNAALVEQSAAASDSLNDHAQRLAEVMATFRFNAAGALHHSN